MAKLIILVGLPGSGKSHYLGRLIEGKVVTSDECVYDDYHAEAIGNSPEPENSRHYSALVDKLNSGNDCVAADIAFCDDEKLTKFKTLIYKKVKDLEIETVYFENKPETCKRNVGKDKSRSVDSRIKDIDRFTKIYKPPKTIRVNDWSGQ